MPKAKLTGAVKTAAAATADNGANAAAASTGGDGANATGTSGESAAGDNADSDGGSSDDPAKASNEDEPPASGGGKPVEAPAAKSLADFRAAFGHEQGSVFFADQVDFATACQSHITAQHKTIAELTAANEALKATNASLSKEVLGEGSPVITGKADDKTPEQKASAVRLGSDGKAAYAASLDEKLAKLQA